MKYSCVIWDWNGTLADDVGASLRAVNDSLQARNMAPIDLGAYHSYIDTPIIRFYERLFDLNQVPMETLSREFHAGYEKYFTGLQKGGEALLKWLQDQGVFQVLLSSSNQQIILRDTEKLGVRKYFDLILGAQDYAAGSKVQRGVDYISRQRFSPDSAVMIGDTLHDLETAKAMGTKCILFSGGHQGKSDLLTAGVPVVDDFAELKSLLF